MSRATWGVAAALIALALVGLAMLLPRGELEMSWKGCLIITSAMVVLGLAGVLELRVVERSKDGEIWHTHAAAGQSRKGRCGWMQAHAWERQKIPILTAVWV